MITCEQGTKCGIVRDSEWHALHSGPQTKRAYYAVVSNVTNSVYDRYNYDSKLVWAASPESVVDFDATAMKKLRDRIASLAAIAGPPMRKMSPTPRPVLDPVVFVRPLGRRRSWTGRNFKRVRSSNES